VVVVEPPKRKKENREQRNEAMKWKQKKCGKIKEHPNIYH
jgi:hypothetical protein